MTPLAPALQEWFTDRLLTQRNCSPQTIAAYRDTFRLLLAFAHERTGKQPFQLDLDDLDAPLIGDSSPTSSRSSGNTVRTRNARLGADPLVLPLLPRSSTPSTRTRSPG